MKRASENTREKAGAESKQKLHDRKPISAAVRPTGVERQPGWASALEHDVRRMQLQMSKERKHKGVAKTKRMREHRHSLLARGVVKARMLAMKRAKERAKAMLKAKLEDRAPFSPNRKVAKGKATFTVPQGVTQYTRRAAQRSKGG